MYSIAHTVRERRSSTSIQNAVEWCLKKFGKENDSLWNRSQYEICWGPDMNDVCATATYYFKNEEDALLFKLTWC